MGAAMPAWGRDTSEFFAGASANAAGKARSAEGHDGREATVASRWSDRVIVVTHAAVVAWAEVRLERWAKVRVLRSAKVRSKRVCVRRRAEPQNVHR